MNPGTPIFGLYGGAPERFASFAALARWLDDSWCFADDRDPSWKWRHGDLMIADWYTQRGHALAWDSVAVIQWDMLVCAPLERIFTPLARDEAYFPGLRPLVEVSDFWWWVRTGTPEGDVYRAFEASLRAARIDTAVWACQFVTAVLPRRFLARYAALPPDELGFLEYKLPTYAKAFGFACRTYAQLPVAWEAEPIQPARVVLSAGKAPIAARDILRELRSGRTRLFHPVTRRFRAGLPSVAQAAIADMLCRRAVRFGRGFRRMLGEPRRAD